jgi:PIN domain nuclease of toxin-antitoxin system
MYDPDVPVYIADTHALFWYRRDPSRLSAAADAVFRLAFAGGAYILVPAIVVAELYYLTQKLGSGISPSTLLADINGSREFVFSALGQAQLERLEDVDDVPEMHDRIIAATALVQGAAIITKDESLRHSKAVEVVW